MPEQYEVQQGDCLSSIAFERGMWWKTIWNDPNNADLREQRSSPNVLFPGDNITIPDKQVKQVNGATEQRHRFRRKDIPCRLVVRFHDAQGDPIANAPCQLLIDNAPAPATRTDDDGIARLSIPPNARSANAIVGEGEDSLFISIALGCLDPIDTIEGIQERLNNLGYACGPVDGIAGPQTEAAIRAFQTDQTLEVDGTAGPETQNALKQAHGI